MKVLLLGGSGQLGTEIRRRWTDCEIVAPSHDDLDIEDGQAVDAALTAVSPGVLVNCAAFHNVDRCEEEPHRAFALNALCVDRMARSCVQHDVTFVTISTDYVFDGEASRPYTEADRPHPISAYAVSKYAGELLVDRLRSRAYVVRTCGLYGEQPSKAKGYTFVDRIIAQARAHEPIRIVRDVIAAPTFAGHLAEALAELLASRAAYGLYHAVNVGPVSWYDFACEVLGQAGIEYAVTPISAAQWKVGARRPAFSALANTKLAGLGIELPPWREGIAAYLRLIRQ